MKTIKIALPTDLESAEIHVFADLHIGDTSCDLAEIKKRIAYVRDTPNAYAILNGDILNNATKTSISDCYAEEYSPMEALEMYVELFSPIKDKILCLTQGNHEARTYQKEGIDLTAVAAKQMGIQDRYSRGVAVVFVKLGWVRGRHGDRQVMYCIACIHGSGGGRKEGAKAIRLAEMADKVDADIYIHSHTHMPMVFREGYYRTDMQKCGVKWVDRLFVNTSASLNYGGYGEEKEFKPASKECPVIYLSGRKKVFSAYMGMKEDSNG